MPPENYLNKLLYKTSFWEDSLKQSSLIKSCDIGLGGSGLPGDNDLDFIYVSKSLDFECLTLLRKNLSEKFARRVSISPLTDFMLSHKQIWDGKTATMIYKGVDWIYGRICKGEKPQPSITFKELQKISKNETPTFLARKLKNMVEKPHKREKMIELLIQQVVKLSVPLD